MKFSRADSRVGMWKFPAVSASNSVRIFRVCWRFDSTKTDHLVPDTSEGLHILKRVSARENFIKYFRRESCKTYKLTFPLHPTKANSLILSVLW
jgi:hypothetical protein